MSRPAFLPALHAHARPATASATPPHPTPALHALALALNLAIAGATLATVGWASAAQAQAAAAPARRHDIPAGPLNAALTRFAQEAGLLLSAPGALTQDKRTAGLSGIVTVDQGFAELLRGQGLAAARQTDGSYALRQTAPADAAAVTTLPAVRVTGAPESMTRRLPAPYAGGWLARGGRVGLLGNKDVMATPFSTASYTSRMIEDWQADTVAQALHADASVRQTFPESGPTEFFNVRGFYMPSTDFAWNGLFGLAPGFQAATEFLERIEVLKGPGALLYGMTPAGSVGGVINLVPKRAGDTPLTRLTARFSSNSQRGAHLDLGRRFGRDDAFGIRVNAVKSDGRPPLDGQSKNKERGSVALDYRGERLRVALDAYRIDGKTRGGMPLFTTFAGGQVPDAPDPTLNPLPGARASEHSRAVIASAEFDFNDQWMGFASVGARRQGSAGYMNNALGRNAQPSGAYIGMAKNTRSFSHAHAADGGIRGRLRTGPVEHEITLSGNAIRQTGGAVQGPVTMWASNIYAPTQPTLTVGPAAPPKSSDNTLSSIALADTLSFMRDQYLLTLGARQQRVRTKNYAPSGAVTTRYDKQALTPALGVVIKPWAAPVSVYANYIEGLSQGDRVTDATAANFGEVFPPYQSKQMELGAKWDAGSLLNTLALFQITRPSLVKNDDSNRYAPDGEQRNRGIEWSIAGEAAPGLRLLGGATYLKAINTRTRAGLLDGKTAIGVPNWLFNLGAEWDTPSLPGLTLRAAAMYTGQQYADSANTQKLPAWTRLDLAARYATRLAAHNVVLRASVENALNKRYWSGAWYGSTSVGTPRAVKLAVSVDF
ncbi:MAG: TonB-dependent siderophore receptor [Achromobacter sp.]|uniref:TonB-dependent siderophore receptor n=1 Tax=Achromobacter sp. TaxID=134375 RepID=UPI003D054148